MTDRGTTRHETATRHGARQQNLQMTLELVARHGATSRADLARRTGLSRTAISSLVGELIDDQLIRELGRGESAGGKPPTLLALNERGREIVALDLGHRPFRAALVDLSGNVHEVVEGDDDVPPTGDEALVVATGLIESVLARSSVPVLGIGIGAPGVIAPDGRVLEASNLAWHGLDLAEEFRRRFEYPISVANDSAMAALAEFRRHPTDRNMILMKLGRGVGAGLVLDGQLYRGQHSAAGEIGHVRVVENGLRCRCDGTGCLETIASVPAMLHAIGADPDNEPWDALTLAGQFGEAKVREVLTNVGTALGATLAPVVATLDVGHVILAPELRNAGDVLVEAVRTELVTRILPSTAEFLQVEATQTGGNLALIGAATAVLVDRFGAML